MAVGEQTKEQIVLMYFLQKGNDWANADSMVHWSQYFGVLKGDTVVHNTISRAGAVKICKRLVPDLLESLSTTGYRSKKVILYRLAENLNGYANIAHRMNYSPLGFLAYPYAKNGVDKYVIPKVEKDISVAFGDKKKYVIWAISKSPTALMMALDGGLFHGDVAKIKQENERAKAFFQKLECAIHVDMASQNRSTLLSTSLNKEEQERDEEMRTFFSIE